MKRKVYQEPTMQIVKVQHTHMLMTSTQAGTASVQDYTWNNEVEEVKANTNYNAWDDDWSNN